MSNPVTNVEIEDVLSSIRRLVSEESRPRRPASAPAPATGRLVLSPALRVPEPAVSDEVTREAPILLTDPAEVPEQEDVPSGALLLEPGDVVHDLVDVDVDVDVDALADDTGPAEALFDPADDGPERFAEPAKEADAEVDRAAAEEADGSGDAATARLEALRDALAAGTGEDDAVFAPPPEAAFEGWAEEGEPEHMSDAPDDGGADGHDGFDNKIATLERLLKLQSQGWQPAAQERPAEDEDRGQDPAEAAAKADPIEDADAGADRADTEDTPEADIAIHFDAVAEAAREALADSPDDTDSPDDPELEVMTAAPDPSAEPDLQPDAGERKATFVRHPAPPTLDWEDHAPAQGVQPMPEPREETPLPAAAVAELSEEALHAMVAEIIREELQGVLGERITRNVRKLVRREIHRVLMSQDFD